MPPVETVIVLDFETTGVSPAQGDRAIEVGAVMLCGGEVVDRFQSLMNPGVRVNGFIEAYTGITNAMVQAAPPAAEVMTAFADFVGSHPLVAHNASFDSRFLDAEFRRVRRRRQQAFGCSLLAARRIYPDAPNHKLETLVRYRNLRTDGTFHRALADAEMAAQLWVRMTEDLRRRYGFSQVPFALLAGLGKIPKGRAVRYLQQCASGRETVS